GALAAVRPECFRLVTTDPGTETNAVSGRLASVAHFGDTLQYSEHAKDRAIVVLAPRAGGVRLDVGDDVWATWAADDVYQFSDRQAGIVLTEASLQPISDES
ncbi:MAG: TOBE domain-containing protein, partial [Actinomycetota bacterium]|nr:TOBE domain-containing protein [Actinomycetota bacterium]